MRAGPLRYTAELQQPSADRDQYGAPNASGWTVVRDVWCSIEPLNGKELESAGAFHPETRYKITMRHDPAIDTTMRLIHQGITYDLRGHINVNLRDLISIWYASTGTTSG